MADDPYDFENDDYEESSTPNFEPFFTLDFERTDEEQATCPSRNTRYKTKSKS